MITPSRRTFMGLIAALPFMRGWAVPAAASQAVAPTVAPAPSSWRVTFSGMAYLPPGRFARVSLLRDGVLIAEQVAVNTVQDGILPVPLKLDYFDPGSGRSARYDVRITGPAHGAWVSQEIRQ